MLKLGKLTDYAVTVMVQLAREGTSRSANYLSQKTGIPEPTVAKVLKSLTRAKLVESERGMAGGYRIAGDAAAVSVAHVIEAMDGPISIVSCIEKANDCGAEHSCPARSKWTPVNDAIKNALHAVKLADMAHPADSAGQSQPRVYQITGVARHAGHE